MLRLVRVTFDQMQRLFWLDRLPFGLIAAVVLLAAGALALQGPALRDALRWNSGFITLNHAIAAHGDDERSDSADNARLAAIVPSNALAQTVVAEQLSYDDLMAWGDKERSEGNDAMALFWYSRATERDPQSADALYYAAIAHESLSQSAEAKATLKQALERPTFNKIGPSDAYARLARVKTQLEGAVNWREILTDTSRALTIDQFAEDSFEEVRAHYLQGEALRNLEEPFAALEAYRWVVSNEPQHYWAHLRLGVLLWETEHDSQQAEEILRRAITLDETHPAAYLRLADMLTETGQVDRAITLYEQLLQFNPSHAQALARLEKLQAPTQP